METAQFLGFSSKNGLAFYNAVTLGASVYSIFGLARKPGPGDYFVVAVITTEKLTQ
jgi:hypothetical protein